MTQTVDRLDRLVEDYLGAVSYACSDLPPERRDDLINDLREHIAAARSVLYQPTEAAVRTILDRLGEPATIAAEARAAEGLGPTTPPAQAPVHPSGPALSRLVTLPLSPVMFTLLLVFALAALAILVSGTVMIMEHMVEAPDPAVVRGDR